jgi:hypothetical protein
VKSAQPPSRSSYSSAASRAVDGQSLANARLSDERSWRGDQIGTVADADEKDVEGAAAGVGEAGPVDGGGDSENILSSAMSHGLYHVSKPARIHPSGGRTLLP